MDHTQLLSLANPMLGALLAAMFLKLWQWQRNRTYILNWAVAYAAGALGFLVEFARFAYSNDWTTFATILLLGVGPVLTARGVILTKQVHAPDMLLLAVYLCGMGLCAVFVFGSANPLLRGLINNWHAAVLALVALWHVVRAHGDSIDRFIPKRKPLDVTE